METEELENFIEQLKGIQEDLKQQFQFGYEKGYEHGLYDGMNPSSPERRVNDRS